MLDLHITPHSGVPIYQQIVSQVTQLITAGRLMAGDELPPIRALAKTLIVNPNTIARAYRELETAGWIHKRRGAGTYVSQRAEGELDAEWSRQLDAAVAAVLAEASRLGVSEETLIERIRRHAKQEKASWKK